MRIPVRTLLGLPVLALLSCSETVSEPQPGASPWDLGDLAPALAVVSSLPAVCEPVTATRLIADETVAVGTLEVVNDEANLYVIYRTPAEWPILKTAVFVGESVSDVPTSGGGHPQVGRFPHKSSHRSGTTEVIWEIPLDAAPGSGLVVAAFAELGDEGAWGEGPMISPDGSWAMYLTHTVSNCAAETVGPAGATLTAPDGNATLSIPSGALLTPVDITISPATVEEIQEYVTQRDGGAAVNATGATSNPATVAQRDGDAAAEAPEATSKGAVAATEDPLPTILDLIPLEGTLWDFEPDGLQFEKPVTVTLHYEDSKIPFGFDESDLGVFIINGVIPFLPAPSFVDPVANTVTATIEHFSYGFIAVRQPVEADLTVSALVESADPIALGQAITYTATLSNAGPSDITDGVVFYQGFGDVVAGPLETGCTLNPASAPATVRIDCDVGAVASGASAVAPSATFVPQSLGDAFEVWVDPASEESDDPLPENNRAVATYSVVAVSAAADLSITEVAESADPVDPGDFVGYAATLRNFGPDAVRDAVVYYRMLGDVEAGPLAPECTETAVPAAADGELVCTVGAVDSDGVVQAPAVIFVPQAAGEYTVWVDPGSSAADPDPTNDRFETTLTVNGATPDLRVDRIEDSPDPTPVGGVVTYEIDVTVVNTTVAVENAVLQVLFAGDFEFASSNTPCSPIVGGVACPLEFVIPGVGWTVQLVTTLPTEGEVIATATIIAPEGVTDSDPTNNSMTETTTVDPPPSDQVAVGDLIEATLPLAGDTAKYSLQLGAPQTIRVHLAHLSSHGSAGLVVRVAGADTTIIPGRFAEAGASDLQSRNEVLSLPAGTYTVAVVSLGSGPYRLGIGTGEGRLDTFYGTEITGFAYGPFGDNAFLDMAIVGDAVVVLGQDALTKFDAGGVPDASFGSAGTVDVSAALNGTATAMAMQPDGRFVVTARRLVSPYPWIVARFEANGAIDATFGTNGIVELTTFGDRTTSHPQGVGFQQNGTDLDIIVAGNAGDLQKQVGIARLDPNGDLETAFGTNGIVFEDGGFAPDGMEIQPDGRILITHLAQVRRYTATGARDATFGTDGLVVYGAGIAVHGLRVMSDGNLLVVGDQSNNALAMRLTSSGVLDGSFGSGGIQLYDFALPERFLAVTETGGGNLLFVGHQRTFGGFWEFLVVKTSAAGALDPDFGVRGYTLESRGDEARAVGLDTQGRLLVGGQQMGSANRIQLSRHFLN